MISKLGLSLLLLIFSTASFALNPSRKYVATPAGSDMLYDSVNIRTADGYRLTAWYCHPPKDMSEMVVVMAGGDAGNMSYDLPLAKFFTDNFNVPVLLFDYRGFGSSQSFPFDTNAVGHPEYLKDIDAAVSYAMTSYAAKHVILYGRSLGGSLALVEASVRPGIIGVVAESPYASQALLAKHVKDKAMNPNAVVTPIASNDLEPGAHMSEIKTPHLLVLHGVDERFILTSELEQLVKLAPTVDKKYLAFEDCDHLEIPFKDPQHFGEAMEQFLGSCRTSPVGK